MSLRNSPLDMSNVPRSGGVPVIGLVGRISPWKGQHIFLRAAAEVLKKYPGARFQIIGAPLFAEQDYDRHLRELAAELGIESSVEFTGFQSNVDQWISRLDLFVHASTTGEPFGQVVIEAMAHAKPVVATRGGGIPEIVQDGVTGLLVPMNDAPAMSLAIDRILADPVAAGAMGAAGRRRVEEHFTIRRTARRVQDIFDTIRPELATDHTEGTEKAIAKGEPPRQVPVKS
jgi:glycosyltransferase involved in cell wall biosynthesis